MDEKTQKVVRRIIKQALLSAGFKNINFGKSSLNGKNCTFSLTAKGDQGKRYEGQASTVIPDAEISMEAIPAVNFELNPI